MYYVDIKTKYNTIKLSVEGPQDPQLIEILEQPYILEVRIEERKSIEELEKERDEALRHLVGTAYYNQVAQEKNEQIRKLKK